MICLNASSGARSPLPNAETVSSQAVIDMILNERTFGLANCLFNRMKLLGDIHALTPLLDHGDDAA